MDIRPAIAATLADWNARHPEGTPVIARFGALLLCAVAGKTTGPAHVAPRGTWKGHVVVMVRSNDGALEGAFPVEHVTTHP